MALYSQAFLVGSSGKLTIVCKEISKDSTYREVKKSLMDAIRDTEFEPINSEPDSDVDILFLNLDKGSMENLKESIGDWIVVENMPLIETDEPYGFDFNLKDFFAPDSNNFIPKKETENSAYDNEFYKANHTRDERLTKIPEPNSIYTW